MKRFLKISFVIVLCLVAVLAVGITVTIGWRPIIGPRSRPLTNRVFERTPERWARGKYIVENVAACADCHSPHDWTKHDAPVTPRDGGRRPGYVDIEGFAGLCCGAQSHARSRDRKRHVERRRPGQSDSRRDWTRRPRVISDDAL